MKNVVIIGGGITGLSAAYFVEKAAKDAGKDVRVTILEASDRLGGKVLTEHAQEFTIEGGPDSFVTDKTACLELCHELGLGEDLIPSNEIQRKIYLLRGKRLIEFPSGFRLTIPTEFKPFILSSLISPLGKLRMALDYFIPPREGDGDVSLSDFIGRRLGREAVDRFAGPLMAGIFVSDPKTMSMKGTFPRFLDMEKKHGSLIRAARAAKKNPPKPNPRAAGRSMFNSLKHGLGTLITTLEKNVKADILREFPVDAIRRSAAGLEVIAKNGRVLQADDVIVTVPAYTAASLLRDELPDLANDLLGIRYVSTTTVSVAYLLSDLPAEKQLDGFGVLIPASEKRDVLAITWSSVKFRHRAPRGCFLLRAFVGGHNNEPAALLPDDELVAKVRAEFQDLFGIVAEPILHRIYRWTKGNPQYDVGHLDRVDAMEAKARALPGLHLAGSAYRGIGMPDCIQQASDVAKRIAPTL